MHVQPRKTTNHSATDMLCDWVTIEKKLGHEQDYQTAQCVLHLEWSQAAWNADDWVVSWRSTDSCECDTLPRDDDPLNRRTLAIRWLFLAIRRLTWLSVVCNILIHVFTWRRSTSAFTRRTLAVVRLYRVSDTHINTWWWPTSALARLCRIDKNVRHSWCIMLLLSTLRCGNYVIIFTAGKSFRPSATNAQHLIKLCEFSRINRNICHF